MVMNFVERLVPILLALNNSAVSVRSGIDHVGFGFNVQGLGFSISKPLETVPLLHRSARGCITS